MILAIIELLITLIKNVSVIIVAAYLLTRTRTYTAVIQKKITLEQRIFLILTFGVFSIYGTLSGIKILGAFANLRDLGPMIGGLIAGPWVGLGAGLIGALHRYSLGGITANSCSLSTVIAGLIGGLFYKSRKGRQITVIPAVLLMLGAELLHFSLALLISHPHDQVVALLKQIVIPMLVTNGIGIAAFIFIVQNLIHEKQTESVKEAIETELKVAREIQMSIVPKIFPPFPDRKEFDIHALLESAKEVGGDFYDFFLIDQNTLCFAIGDVSGKGVPASLFMAVTKTLLKATAVPGLKPDAILTAVNNELCRDNDSGMFVTTFLGLLDIPSGRILYSNGGHNLPYLLHKDGQLIQLRKTPGMALGAMENTVYGLETLDVASDDALILYTDGVTEAMDLQGNLYGEKQLEHFLQTIPGLPAEATNRQIMTEIKRHADKAPQSDDITILSLKIKQALA